MRRILTVVILIMTTIAMQAQGVMDVHSHILTPGYLAALQHHGASLDEGFPLPQWDVERQLQFMDEASIATSVLTLAAPHPYFGDSKECASIIRRVNELSASLKQQHPGRFKFCAALPLPDVRVAVCEAVYAIDTLGADGIKLATNCYGQYLGVPELDTLMQVLDDRHAVVILHPHRPEPVNRDVMTQTPLAMQEYLGETTRAIANMITRNIPARYPHVKFVIPHCGAFLPLAIPRMRSLYPVMRANGLVGEVDWEKNLASFYYDLAGSHSPEVIKMMLTITTPDHILYGSDYPYVSPAILHSQLERMKQYLADDPQLAPYRDMFLEHNARHLFGDRDDMPVPKVADDRQMIVRIAEIEVHENYLEQYLDAAAQVGGLSVEKEPGVICIFPMQVKDRPNVIRIIEIYRDQDAYQEHLATPHFKQYKQGTLHMVKDLKLVDTSPLDPQAMSRIFLKK